MSEFICGHCGHVGVAHTNGLSAPWCANCQMNDKLTLRVRCKHGLFETCMMCYKDGEFIGKEWKEPEPKYTLEQAMERLMMCDKLLVSITANKTGYLTELTTAEVIGYINERP